MKNISTFGTLVALAAAINTNVLALPVITANNETVTIGGIVFTCKTSPATAYEFAPGDNAAGSIANLVACINATSATTKLQAIATTGAVLILDSGTRGTLACSETLAGSGNAWLTAATFGSGSTTDAPEIPLAFSRTCIAAEDTGKLMVFGLPFTPVEVIVQVRTSAGAIKAWDGKLTKGTNHVLLNSDGSADIAENDVVTILATM